MHIVPHGVCTCIINARAAATTKVKGKIAEGSSVSSARQVPAIKQVRSQNFMIRDERMSMNLHNFMIRDECMSMNLHRTCHLSSQMFQGDKHSFPNRQEPGRTTDCRDVIMQV